jgi:adenylate cyclase
MKFPKIKIPLFVVSIPIILVAALFQLTFDLGEQGRLDSTFLRENIYPVARSINGSMTNIKFRMRGPRPPKQKIIIVAADDRSIETLGRWPWHRENIGHIIHSAFRLGAKQVGIDIVFSEAEERIPPEVYTILDKKSPSLASELRSFEGDPVLTDVIKAYREHLVLGYTPQIFCQPRYDHGDQCPVDDPDLAKAITNDLSKFSTTTLTDFDYHKTPILHMLTSVSNIPAFHDAAKYAGFFFVTPDPDGYIRRYPLYFVHHNQLYPSLAIKMAEIAKGETLKVTTTNDSRIDSISFPSDTDSLPVTPLGYIDLNFRGPRESFTYVSAVDVMRGAESNDPKLKELFKDSLVLFGATALGIYDMRAFPFDSNTPGVEGHATALDNLLSKDSLRSASGIHQQWLPLMMIIALGLLFAILFSRFEAVPSLLIFGGFILIFGAVDVELFKHNINLPSAFLMIEILAIFALVLAIRYILEEKNKKYVRMAFSHYLAPQIVDMVLKDPSKLAVGGERKDITILFSDLRGFTTISENMDPKTLSQFLNEYLSEMTDIVFEFGGTLDKYIGDAVMAFWGAPVDQPDHALRACLAGLKMQKRLHEIAPDYKARYQVDVGMGVGINTGVVSVGNMGSKKIFEFTVIGDHVNLASRLEGLTRIYGVDVLSTMNTIEALPAELKQQIHYRVLDAVKVKGKKNASDLIEISLYPFSEKALELFYLAKDAFKKRDWVRSIELFKKSNQLYQEHRGQPDPVCEIFIQRCEYFEINPPTHDWDGTIEMKSK